MEAVGVEGEYSKAVTAFPVGYTIPEVHLLRLSLVITKKSLDEKISLTLTVVVVLHCIGYALDVNDPLSKDWQTFPTYNKFCCRLFITLQF